MNSPNSPNSKYMTVKEMRGYLKIGQNTAYALLQTQGFPYIRIGKRYLIDNERLDTFLTKNPHVLL